MRPVNFPARVLTLAPALALALGLVACRTPDPPPISGEFRDDFARDSVGGNYVATAPVYRLKDGALNVQNGYNHPLWLRKKMPMDAVVELDCWSTTAAGDIKVEVWGDGEYYDANKGRYTGTGYIFIMGGWSNSKSIIARGAEHGADVKARPDPKVEPNKKYHWKIARKGGHIDWYVDDMATPFLSYDDAQPFTGSGHEYFAFNNWEADVWYDNLVIRQAE